MNLRRVNCIAMIERLDVAQLVGLAKLEAISLPLTCVNPQRLLELPALKKLSLHRPAISDATLLARLRMKGVAVRVYD